MTIERTKKGILIGSAILLLALFVFTFMNQTVSSFILDINPSMQVETNRMNRINKVTPLNADAKQLLEGYNARGKTVDRAVEELVDRLILQGYLRQSDDNRILLSGDTDGLDKKTEGKLRSIIEKLSAERSLNTKVTSTISEKDDDVKKEADSLGISTGKLSLIRSIMQKDPTKNVNQLKDRSIRELTELDDDDKSEAPKTEKPKTEKPKTEAPKTEAPKTEAPKPAPAVQSYDDDDDDDDDDDYYDDDEYWIGYT